MVQDFDEGKSLHIADVDFSEIYRDAFSSMDESRTFAREVKALPQKNRMAKVVFHQAGRMVWLADRMGDIAAGREALQILFLLIAAEVVAKMVFSFQGKGQSKKYVHRFFEEICDDSHRLKLDRAFARYGITDYISYKNAIDLLYTVRCEVAHEAMYYKFQLKEEGHRPPVLALIEEFSVVSHITLRELRQIVLQGVIQGCRRLSKE